jgi:molecular chaperone GrpE (heat shock protein)
MVEAAWHHLAERMDAADIGLRRSTESALVAKRKLLLAIVEDVMDNLDRSISAEEGLVPDRTQSAALMRLIGARRLVERVLTRERVTAFDVRSAVPGLVFVAEVEERSDVPDGDIVEVVLRGYTWNGELLRMAQVKIAQNATLPNSHDGLPGHH